MPCPNCNEKLIDRNKCKCGWREKPVMAKDDEKEKIEDSVNMQKNSKKDVDSSGVDDEDKSKDGNAQTKEEVKDVFSPDEQKTKMSSAANDAQAKDDKNILDKKVEMHKEVESGDKLSESYENKGECKTEETREEIPVEETGKKDSSSMTIDEQIASGNINNIMIEIKKILHDPQEKFKFEDGDQFEDPTIPYNPIPSCFANYKLSEFDEYHKALKEENIIVVSCFEEDILNHVSHTMIEKLDTGTNYKWRLLPFDGKNFERSDLHLDSICNYLVNNDEHIVLVVEANRPKGRAFLDSLFVSHSHSLHYKRILKDKDVFMICHANPEVIKERANEIKQAFTTWEIDYFKPLLRDRYQGKYKECEEDLLKQRKAFNQSDQDFYNLIQDGQLIDQIKVKSVSRVIAELDQKVETVFRDIGEIQKTVLYTVAYFQGLSPSVFNELVKLFLTDKTKSETIREIRKNVETGKEELVESQETKRLNDIWQNNHDQILRECNLEVIRMENQAKAIAFVPTFPRGEKPFREYFERNFGMYIEDQFDIIQESDLLFHNSLKVAENVVNIAIDVAKTDSARFQKFLIYCLNNKDDFNFVYSRICLLIKEMLNHKQLHGTVKSVMEWLLTNRQDTTALEIVARLRFNPKFDLFNWLKQLLERSKIHDATYALLIKHMMQSRPTIYIFLKELELWLPGKEVLIDNYSQTNKCSLRLFMNYSIVNTLHFPVENYGMLPSRFPFFMNYEDVDKRSTSSNLIYWLFHPGIKCTSEDSDNNELMFLLIDKWFATKSHKKRQTQTENFNLIENAALIINIIKLNVSLLEKVRDTTNVIISLLIAEWYVILHGLREDRDHEEKAVIIFKNLFFENTVNEDKAIFLELVICWQEISSFLLDSYNMLDFSNYGLKKVLNRRYNLVKQLIKFGKKL